jgi:hypothetical protein
VIWTRPSPHNRCNRHALARRQQQLRGARHATRAGAMRVLVLGELLLWRCCREGGSCEGSAHILPCRLRHRARAARHASRAITHPRRMRLRTPQHPLTDAQATCNRQVLARTWAAAASWCGWAARPSCWTAACTWATTTRVGARAWMVVASVCAPVCVFKRGAGGGGGGKGGRGVLSACSGSQQGRRVTCQLLRRLSLLGTHTDTCVLVTPPPSTHMRARARAHARAHAHAHLPQTGFRTSAC